MYLNNCYTIQANIIINFMFVNLIRVWIISWKWLCDNSQVKSNFQFVYFFPYSFVLYFCCFYTFILSMFRFTSQNADYKVIIQTLLIHHTPWHRYCSFITSIALWNSQLKCMYMFAQNLLEWLFLGNINMRLIISRDYFKYISWAFLFIGTKNSQEHHYHQARQYLHLPPPLSAMAKYKQWKLHQPNQEKQDLWTSGRLILRWTWNLSPENDLQHWTIGAVFKTINQGANKCLSYIAVIKKLWNWTWDSTWLPWIFKEFFKTTRQN